MRIHVTQDNIDHGLRGSSTQDPVALALRDAGFIRPLVGLGQIRVDGCDGGFMRQYAPTPYAVVDFIALFDQGERVSPMSFEVEL